MEHSRSFDQLFETMMRATRCPFCNASFCPSDASLVDDRAERRLFHLCCGSCGRALLALVSFAPAGLFSFGTLTDCSAEDALRFHAAASISADDVLMAYEELTRNSFCPK